MGCWVVLYWESETVFTFRESRSADAPNGSAARIPPACIGAASFSPSSSHAIPPRYWYDEDSRKPPTSLTPASRAAITQSHIRHSTRSFRRERTSRGRRSPGERVNCYTPRRRHRGRIRRSLLLSSTANETKVVHHHITTSRVENK